MCAIQEMLEQTQSHWNFSSLWLTVSCQEKELSMCVLTLKRLPQHPTWKTRICKDSVIKNSRRIHQRIQPHHLGAQRLGIFRNPSWLLWTTTIRDAGKQTTQSEIRKIGLLWSKKHPRSMETQMETYTIFFSSGWLWSWICGKATCRASGKHIEKIS